MAVDVLGLGQPQVTCRVSYPVFKMTSQLWDDLTAGQKWPPGDSLSTPTWRALGKDIELFNRLTPQQNGNHFADAI